MDYLTYSFAAVLFVMVASFIPALLHAAEKAFVKSYRKNGDFQWLWATGATITMAMILAVIGICAYASIEIGEWLYGLHKELFG